MLICEFVNSATVDPARLGALRDAMEELCDRNLVAHFRWAGPVLNEFPHMRVELADGADGFAVAELVRDAIVQSGLGLIDVANLPDQSS